MANEEGDVLMDDPVLAAYAAFLEDNAEVRIRIEGSCAACREAHRPCEFSHYARTTLYIEPGDAPPRCQRCVDMEILCVPRLKPVERNSRSALFQREHADMLRAAKETERLAAQAEIEAIAARHPRYPGRPQAPKISYLGRRPGRPASAERSRIVVLSQMIPSAVINQGETGAEEVRITQFDSTMPTQTDELIKAHQEIDHLRAQLGKERALNQVLTENVAALERQIANQQQSYMHNMTPDVLFSPAHFVVPSMVHAQHWTVEEDEQYATAFAHAYNYPSPVRGDRGHI